MDRDVALLCNPSAGGGRAARVLPGAILGVLPGGRGNDLVRALGIPLDPRAACEVIATGTPRPLDVGDVDGRTSRPGSSCMPTATRSARRR